MAGLATDATYYPTEIHGPGHAKRAIAFSVTIPKGENLVKGTVMGIEPGTLTMAKAYDHDGAVASASTPAAGAANVGNGTISSITVSDTHTNSEEWTLTCISETTNLGNFEVKGSVSGVVGTATVGAAFNHANEIIFTIADGATDFDKGDTFTFHTHGAAAVEAVGILTEDVDATLEDKFSTIEVSGVFLISALTGLDSDAYASMFAKVVGAYMII